MTEIRTERLLLRRARPDDLDAMYAIMSDTETMRYWSSLPHATREVTAHWFEEMLTEAPGRDLFVAEHEGRVVARLGMWQAPEITFIFHRDVWGLGLAQEAMTALVAHAFEDGASRLTADVDPRNERSLRLLHRLGFVETHRAERTFRLGDEWADSVYLELLRPKRRERVTEIISLSKARKTKARAEKEATAAANLVKFGRTKAEKQKAAAEKSITEKMIDAHKRETP